MKYDSRSHALALKSFQAAEAKAQRLNAQADRIRAEAQKYQDAASGLVDARRADVLLSLGRAAYADLVQHAPKGLDAVDTWLRLREFSIPVREVGAIRADLRHVRGEPEPVLEPRVKETDHAIDRRERETGNDQATGSTHPESRRTGV